MFYLNRIRKELKLEISDLEIERDSVKEKLVLEREIKSLKETLSNLKIQQKEQVKELKHDRKISEEDVKHMVRMKEERLDIVHEKKLLSCDQEKAKAIEIIRNEYRDKIEKRLEGEVKNIKNMYSEVLGRLPNVNVRLKGEA